MQREGWQYTAGNPGQQLLKGRGLNRQLQPRAGHDHTRRQWFFTQYIVQYDVPAEAVAIKKQRNIWKTSPCVIYMPKWAIGPMLSAAMYSRGLVRRGSDDMIGKQNGISKYVIGILCSIIIASHTAVFGYLSHASTNIQASEASSGLFHAVIDIHMIKMVYYTYVEMHEERVF